MTRKRHVRFGGKDEETRPLGNGKVRLVLTLHLVMFQTVVAYEAIYAVISLAQAVCRVWRLGQTRPVQVFALGYRGIELEAWNVIARKISWAKSVYGDFVPSALGNAGVDDNLDLLRALTERITGEAKDSEAILSTTLAGINAPITMLDLPTTPVPEVFHSIVVIETWADWASRKGTVVVVPMRRRPGGAVSPLFTYAAPTQGKEPGAAESETVICPECGEKMQYRGDQERHLQAQGGQEVVFKRSYAVCPECGTGFFPPG